MVCFPSARHKALPYLFLVQRKHPEVGQGLAPCRPDDIPRLRQAITDAIATDQNNTALGDRSSASFFDLGQGFVQNAQGAVSLLLIDDQRRSQPQGVGPAAQHQQAALEGRRAHGG